MKKFSKSVVSKTSIVLIVCALALTVWVLLNLKSGIKPRNTPACQNSFRKAPAPGARHGYFLPLGYKTNPVRYFNDLKTDARIYQPGVYNFAAHFATRQPNRWLIDVGCGSGIKAAKIYENSRVNVVEIDFGNNLELSKAKFRETRRFARSKGTDVQWSEWDVSSGVFPKIDASRLQGATIVASDIIEHLPNPDLLVDPLLALLHGCGAESLIISTKHRRPEEGNGPASNVHHVREWSIRELAAYLTSRGANVRQCVLTETRAGTNMMGTSACLISKKYKGFPDRSEVNDYFKNYRE